MPNRSNENYHAITEGLSKCGTTPKHKLTSKSNGYQWNKQNNQERVGNIGLLTVVNDGRRDNQRRHENYRKHDNHYNQDRYARPGTLYNKKYERPNNARCDQRRYDNHDYNNQDRYMRGGALQVDERYEKHNNERYENQKRHDNYNRYDNQNKYGNQNKRDNYNRYDKQYKQEDAQNKRDTQSRMKEQNDASGLAASRQYLIPAHTWRVVCDSMLGGLSSKLRMCGVDCVHVLFDQGGDDSAQLAMRENRILLTRNKNYEKVRLTLHILYV